MKRILAFLTATAVALVVTSTALAGSLGCGHSATCGPGQNGGGGLPGNGVHSSGTGTLPFTGLNLAVVAGLALLLIVSGILLRRTTRPHQ